MTPLQVANTTANHQFVRWATVVPQLELFWQPGMHLSCRPRQQLVVLKVMLIANRIAELEYEQMEDSPSVLLARSTAAEGGREAGGQSTGVKRLLGRVGKAMDQLTHREPLPALPNEIWLEILGFARCSELGRRGAHT